MGVALVPGVTFKKLEPMLGHRYNVSMVRGSGLHPRQRQQSCLKTGVSSKAASILLQQETLVNRKKDFPC